MRQESWTIGIYMLPVIFLVLTPFLMWHHSRDKGPLGGCIAGGVQSGVINAVIQFFVLLPLLVKGTDGPGGLIALILPVVTLLAAMILAFVVGFPLELIRIARNKNSQKPISPEAMTLLGGQSNSVRRLSSLFSGGGEAGAATDYSPSTPGAQRIDPRFEVDWSRFGASDFVPPLPTAVLPPESTADLRERFENPASTGPTSAAGVIRAVPKGLLIDIPSMFPEQAAARELLHRGPSNRHWREFAKKKSG